MNSPFSIVAEEEICSSKECSDVVANTNASYEPEDIGLDKDHDEELPRRQRRSTTTKYRRKMSVFDHMRQNFQEDENPSHDGDASVWLTGWNVSCLIQASAMLGMPFAIRQSGWAGIPVLCLLAAICCYTGKLLVSCQYEESKLIGRKIRLRTSYARIAEAAYRRPGYRMVSIVQFIEVFGNLIAFVVLLGTVLRELLHAKTGLGFGEWAAISCLLTIPSLFVKRLSRISWFSIISVLALSSTLILITTYSITKYDSWKISNIPVFNLSTFPMSIGLFVFSYSAHPYLSSIEASMKKPESFKPMMNVTFTIATILKAVFGVFVVLAFGSETAEVATVNLLGNEAFNIASNTLVIMFVMFTIPLFIFVLGESLDDALIRYFPRLNEESKYHWVWLLITRPMFLGASLLVAVVVPHFTTVMSLIGSLTGTCLCFIFPCLFYMKLRWQSIGKARVLLNVGIMVTFSISGGFGVYSSARSLFDNFH